MQRSLKAIQVSSGVYVLRNDGRCSGIPSLSAQMGSICTFKNESRCSKARLFA